jgi:phage shock protein A
MDGIAQALLTELSNLDKDLEKVGGARPRLDEHLADLTDKATRLRKEICEIEVELNAAVLSEERAAAQEDANTPKLPRSKDVSVSIWKV